MLRFFLSLAFLAAPALAQAQVSTQPATVEGLYPAKTRDPMMISTVYGDQTGKGTAGVRSGVATSSFSVYNLTLTGVMQDASGRQALLADAATGAVYKLKSGRLYDQKKKPVPGVSGVIKGKQVILLTEDKKVRQINFREKE